MRQKTTALDLRDGRKKQDAQPVGATVLLSKVKPEGGTSRSWGLGNLEEIMLRWGSVRRQGFPTFLSVCCVLAGRSFWAFTIYGRTTAELVQAIFI
jgi:hypothetical protein